jgi:hypothetical protein
MLSNVNLGKMSADYFNGFQMQTILETKLRFKTKVPLEISELQKDEISNKHRTLHNQALRNLHSSLRA